MDAYVREIGMEMQTYSVNGSQVQPRNGDAFIHAVLVAYVKRVATLEPVHMVESCDIEMTIG